MNPRIRPIEEQDLPELTRIYNHYVVETAITFDVEPYTVEKRRATWYADFEKGRYSCLVPEIDGKAAGWACTRQFRTKAAYDSSVEMSVYLDPGLVGRGLGRQLYEALFASLEGGGFHMALAGITLPNEASIRLHERFGFTSVGVFREVGFKLGRYWDVQWLERPLR